jgi:hypothetical protein
MSRHTGRNREFTVRIKNRRLRRYVDRMRHTMDLSREQTFKAVQSCNGTPESFFEKALRIKRGAVSA